MTEKQIDIIAKAVAKAVIAAMEIKQQEYDKEFAKHLESKGVEWEYLKIPSEPQETINRLKRQLSQAIEDEDYAKADKINKEIIELKKRLK